MDIIAIILTIAACIGGLIALYFIAALIMFKIASKKAKAFIDADPFDRTFDQTFDRFDRIHNRR